MSLIDPTQSVLEAAMSGAMQRQTVLTGDLANADTPNFEPSDVDFQDQLAAAINAGDSPSQLQNLTYTSTTSSGMVSPDGNGVDSDQVSADLAENGLEYQALAEVLAAHNSILQYAMGTG